MELLEAKFRPGARVRVTGSSPLYAAFKSGQVGRVARVKPVMVPACVAQGEPAPPDWVWFAYVVRLDDGAVLDGIAEKNLLPIVSIS